MANEIIDRSHEIIKATKDTETAVSATVSNINAELSKIDASPAMETFRQFADIFSGFAASVAASTTAVTDGVSGLFASVSTLGDGVIKTADGLTAMAAALPLVGTAMLAMLVNLTGITGYIPQLLIFIAAMLALSLMGAGLAAAGSGLLGIGAGLIAMTEGMAALIAFMPLFIESLAGITQNIGGIIAFVLLAAAVLIMAVALESLNGQLEKFVKSMGELSGLMSVGFVAAFTVFALMLAASSLVMGKVATGLDKITKAIEKQIARLTILNPLLAAQAILTNPIVGAITVAAALAGGLLVSALLPKMATGGVVSSPTVALVGEGRYPEAVVPLGESPQFGQMKADIANAVVMAMGMSSRNSSTGGSTQGGETVTLNIDGQSFARLILPKLRKENSRRGYDVALHGV